MISRIINRAKNSEIRYKLHNWVYSHSVLFKTRKLFYSQWISKGDLCFDVGANVGNRTSVFLSLGANVIAIEPIEKCKEILKLKFGNSLRVVPKAVGSESGEMPFFRGSTSTLSTMSEEWKERVSKSRFESETWHTPTTIAVTTLENLIGEYGVPSFIKIDVEGYEKEVLLGLDTAVQTLSFEYTVPEMSDALHSCLTQINKISENYKFNYTVAEGMQLVLPKWMSCQEMLLYVNKDEFLRSGCGDVYASLKNDTRA